MKLFLAILPLLSVVYSAPLTQYLLYTPNTFSEVLKVQPQIVQSTTPLKLDNGKQVLYYYPSAPLTAAPAFSPYQVILLRDDGDTAAPTDFWSQIQSWWESIAPGGGQGAQPAAPAESPAASGTKLEKPMDMTMAKDEKKEMKDDKKKFYIIAGPQLLNQYPSVAALPSPIYSMPFGTVLGRSKDVDMVVEQPAVPIVEPVIKAAALEQTEPIVVPEPQVVPAVHVLPQARSSIESLEKDMIMEMPKEDMEKKEEIKEIVKLEVEPIPEAKEFDDPSVASAKPVALALSGKGGLAAAKPVATSIVGDGGIAQANPMATSVAGEFLEEEEEKKQ